MVLSLVKSNIKIKRVLKAYWKDYMLQSILFAMLTLILFLLLSLEGSVMISTLASSIFIVFALPKRKTAHPKNIFLGDSIRIIVGSLCALIPDSMSFYKRLNYSLAVGLAIFVMLLLNVSHPPETGVALSFVINGFSLRTFFALISCVALLIRVLHFFKDKLKDIV